MTKPFSFRYLKTSPEIIRLTVMIYVLFLLSLCAVEGLLHALLLEPLRSDSASEIRLKRIQRLGAYLKWKGRVDELFMKINGKWHYP